MSWALLEVSCGGFLEGMGGACHRLAPLSRHERQGIADPGGGIALDGQRWIACRPGFFLPVRVLSNLFRRLFLEQLDAAFATGRLGFHSGLAGLQEPAAFAHPQVPFAPAPFNQVFPMPRAVKLKFNIQPLSNLEKMADFCGF